MLEFCRFNSQAKVAVKELTESVLLGQHAIRRLSLTGPYKLGMGVPRVIIKKQKATTKVRLTRISMHK